MPPAVPLAGAGANSHTVTIACTQVITRHLSVSPGPYSHLLTQRERDRYQSSKLSHRQATGDSTCCLRTARPHLYSTVLLSPKAVHPHQIQGYMILCVHQSINHEWGCSTSITIDPITNREHSWWLIHWHSQAVVYVQALASVFQMYSQCRTPQMAGSLTGWMRYYSFETVPMNLQMTRLTRSKQRSVGCKAPTLVKCLSVQLLVQMY